MAGETLRTASQLLAEFPDNTAGLIDAVNSRNGIVSVVVGVGFMEDNQAQFTITVVAGVPVDINGEIIPGPVLRANFAWQIDGNNAWIPDYSGIIVPAGVERLVAVNTSMLIAKVGGGTASYSWQVFKAGLPVGNPVTTPALDQNNTLFQMTEEVLYEPALGETIDIRVTGNATSDDITVLDFRQRVSSVLL